MHFKSEWDQHLSSLPHGTAEESTIEKLNFIVSLEMNNDWPQGTKNLKTSKYCFLLSIVLTKTKLKVIYENKNLLKVILKHIA